jgi:hypothetical protein
MSKAIKKINIEDIEIEESLNPKAVPALKSVGTYTSSDSAGLNSTEVASFEGQRRFSEERISQSQTTDDNRSLSPVNLFFNRSSEGSAFRRVESPGIPKIRSTRNLTSPREPFTPGPVFSPQQTYGTQSIRRTINFRRELGDDRYGVQDESADLEEEKDQNGFGAFQHHLPVPTPLGNQFSGGDQQNSLLSSAGSEDSRNADRLIGMLTASSPELNLMGLVSQLIGNPRKWAPSTSEDDAPSLSDPDSRSMNTNNEENIAKPLNAFGFSRVDLMTKFTEHAGGRRLEDDGDATRREENAYDNDNKIAPNSSVIRDGDRGDGGRYPGPTFSNSPQRSRPENSQRRLKQSMSSLDGDAG